MILRPPKYNFMSLSDIRGTADGSRQSYECLGRWKSNSNGMADSDSNKWSDNEVIAVA